VLALGTEVSSEALAETTRVIADAAAGAVAAPLVTVAEEHVRSRWALLKGAVRTTVAQVTNAANMLHCVPWRVVGLGSLSSELLLGVADTTAGAVVRANSTLAGDAVVVLEALALAGLAVTDALVGALNLRVCLVGGGSDSDPCSSLWACAKRAVVLSPSGVAVRAGVAHALVVPSARAVAGAPVRAVRGSQGGVAGKGNEKEGTCHDY